MPLPNPLPDHPVRRQKIYPSQALVGMGIGLVAFVFVLIILNSITSGDKFSATTVAAKPTQPVQPLVIQFPPWWEVLLFMAGLIVLALLVYLVWGPIRYFFRKHYQKYYGSNAQSEDEIEKLAKVNPADIQEVVAAQLAISSNYYESVLQQSQRSFNSAIIFAAIGLAFFMAGIGFLVYKDPASFVNPSIIGGALTEFLSGINFYLYGKATSQLETFHIRLDGIQRFAIANSVCENLEGDIKQTTRSELVRAMFTNSFETPDTKQQDGSAKQDDFKAKKNGAGSSPHRRFTRKA